MTSSDGASRRPPMRQARRTSNRGSSSSSADLDTRHRIAELTRAAWRDGARSLSESRLTPALLDDVDRGVESGLASAPVIVVICGDRSIGHEAVLPSSVFPATQNLLLAANAQGLGSALTTLATLRPTELAGLLGLPDTVRPMAVVPLGWPRGPSVHPVGSHWRTRPHRPLRTTVVHLIPSRRTDLSTTVGAPLVARRALRSWLTSTVGNYRQATEEVDDGRRHAAPGPGGAHRASGVPASDHPAGSARDGDPAQGSTPPATPVSLYSTPLPGPEKRRTGWVIAAAVVVVIAAVGITVVVTSSSRPESPAVHRCRG